MKPMILLPCLAFAAFEAAAAMAVSPNDQPETVTIPLDQIWAYNMPGTRDVQELVSDARSLLFMEIRRSLWSLPVNEKNAGQGFAVSGNESEALGNVHAVLVEGNNPRQTFSRGSSIHVAFFSYQSRPYVHLHKVERQTNTVNIRWRFVPHETEETTEHFALIPLGILPSGKYRVNIIRSPMPKKYADLGFRRTSDVVANRNVCRSFSFDVTDQEE